MVWNDLNKQTKQVGLQIGLGSCSVHKWMKGNGNGNISNAPPTVDRRRIT